MSEPRELEIAIENAWLGLADMPYAATRTFYLWRSGKLSRYMVGSSEEVGTFTRAIPLKDFREAVFCAYEIQRGRYG